MKFINRNLKYIAAACAALFIGIVATSAFGQVSVGKAKTVGEHKSGSRTFCSDDHWGESDRVSFRELREMTLASTGSLRVDAGTNGGISVKGEDRNDILVRACVQAWGDTDEAAKNAVAAVKVNTAGEIGAESSAGNKNWSVSYQILVPRMTNLDLRANNGGINISGTDGTAEFETRNGGINLQNIAGNVKGRTTNGGVNVALAGTTWKGSGLDVQTTNGGVKLSLPENYAAQIETGTVNGGFRSDIPALNVTTEDIKGDSWGRSRSRRITTSINGGGAPIRVITTNGGVNISTTNEH